MFYRDFHSPTCRILGHRDAKEFRRCITRIFFFKTEQDCGKANKKKLFTVSVDKAKDLKVPMRFATPLALLLPSLALAANDYKLIATGKVCPAGSRISLPCGSHTHHAP